MKTVLFTTALLAAATTAQAQDAKHFDGGFIGAELGYMDAGDGINGVYFGANAGWRKQMDSDFVWGIEGTFGKSNVDYGGFDDVYDHQWTAMPFIGKAFGAEKRSLVTLGAGYAEAKASIAGASATGNGFAAALGYEYALGENWSVRAKATTYEFDSVIGTIGLGLRF